MEDEYHFLLHCPAYQVERQKTFELQQPYGERENLIIGTFLFSASNIENKKDTLWNMWKIRDGHLRS